MKVIKIPEGKGIAKITKEVAVLKRLSHPLIIKIRDYFEFGNRFFIIMDYAAGI